ncbi:kinase-like protein, partial [Macrolepiota fuliginosa MF-IS2]
MFFAIPSYKISWLGKVLRQSANILTAVEQKRVLSILCKLAKAALVFPRCYELKGVSYDFRPLQGGGFADVYKGKYKNDTICLKIIRIFQNDQRHPLAAHAGELILWAFLSHPNLLPFYGVYIEQQTQRFCLISPWMENGNLCDYLESHPYSNHSLLVSDVVHGLSYLHQRGVVHGDLKGQNILISGDGRAMIADFGISHVAMSTRYTTSPKGSVRWSAPELFSDSHNDSDSEAYALPTPESDIWSFSCVCYEIFTRKVPFYQYPREHKVMAVLLKGMEIPIRPALDDPDGVDDVMWNIMKQCWNYTPKERP